MSAPLKQFVITKRSEAYWRVTFNNPPLNLINPETILELKHLMELIEAQSDSSRRCL
jgi:enoyl-CoA hydratase/carnithine racemase